LRSTESEKLEEPLYRQLANFDDRHDRRLTPNNCSPSMQFENYTVDDVTDDCSTQDEI